MGQQLWERSPGARALLQQVDEVLEAPLTQLMFHGPEAELVKTVNAQPAIMAVSLACLKAMETTLGPQAMPQPTFVAGHSLGEYTALVAAGVLDVPDAVRLVRERGRSMQEAAEQRAGAMAAIIGLDELAVEEVCRETGATISNVNADDQVVIAGDWVTLARAMDLASLRGARRLIRLQVGGAFHSPLMEPAAVRMAAALDHAHFRDPKVPLIANCSGRPLTTARSIRDELARQLISCVQWHRSVQYMLGAGVTAFYEIGPGRVLTSLLRRMQAGTFTVNVDDHAAVHALAG
jgi:[acyl-carrier-protein] S-malonyltransferase